MDSVVRGTQVLLSRHASSVVVAHGLSCPVTCGILVHWPGIKPVSPALEGGFFTTGPPGKSWPMCYLEVCYLISMYFRMDLENIILCEVSQEKKNTIWHHLYVESKIWQKWTYLQKRSRLTDTDNRLVVAKGERGYGGMNWEFGISRCKLLYIEWTNNKVLLYSTGNYIQYPVINHNGKKYEKEYIYIYV